MWSNTLDSDMIKGFVSLGTELIKIIDNIGLLNSILLAFGAYKGFGALFKTFSNAGITVQSLTKNLWAYINGVQATAVAETKLTQVQLQKKLTQQGLTNENIKAIIAETGLGVSTDRLTKETLEATMTTLGYSKAQRQATVDKIFGTQATVAATIEEKILRAEWIKSLATQYLTKKSTEALEKAKYALKLAEMGLMNGIATVSDVQAAQAAVQAASIPVDISKIGTTELLGLAFNGLAASVLAATKAIVTFLFTNPIGWAILAAAAVLGAVAAWNKWGATTENLTEKLDELKSELSDLRSELNDVNSELKETNERMAELLAKDKLTFEEQEELDRLRATNDELERRKELLEDEEKNNAGRVGRQAARVVDSNKKEKDWWEKAMLFISPTVDVGRFSRDEEDEVFKNLSDYAKLKDKYDNAPNLKKQDKYQKKLDKEADKIDEYISKLSEALDGVEYGDSEESDAALDYLAELESKYAIARGSASAKINAVKGVFNKDEFSETKEAIDGYVKALSDGDAGAKESIKNIIENNADLVEDLEARGVEAQDAIDYYTKLGSEANYATIDGKIQEVSRAANTFESLLDGGLFKVDDVDIGLAELFDEEGKVIQTKLSQVFNDTSDQTRKDITYLLEGSYEQIKNGTADTEKLLTGFGLKTTQQVLDIQNKLLGEQNLELFPNLKDEINGIIDTFSEFSKAVGGVVDALDTLEKARAEEAYSGSISIETLENLMKYTDDYTQLVEIDETGAIRLAADAEQILIEQRLKKIQTDAAAAVQTAQTNLEQAKYNAKAVNETGPVQEALTSATDALAGSWAYLGSLIGDVTDGNFSGMFERASSAYGNVTAGREENRAQVNVSVEDAEEALANALNQQKIADALTSDNVKTKYSSDEASGGNETKEDAEKDLIEEGWEKLLAKYENQLALLSNERDLIQAEIDKAEARGGKASAKYYEDLVNNSAAEKKLLEEKKAALEEYLAANAGAIDQDTWTDYNNEINATAVAIKECEINTIEWAEAIREIDLHYFEQATDEISRLGEELDFVNSLLEDEEVADENGNWSSAALTRMGLYTQQMEKAAVEAARYQDEIDDLNDEHESGALSEEQYQEKLSDLVSGQQDAIQSYEDAKDSIVELNEARIDAIRDGIEKEIEAYSDLTDAKKEELSAERD